jgi:hypothetical protein
MEASDGDHGHQPGEELVAEAVSVRLDRLRLLKRASKPWSTIIKVGDRSSSLASQPAVQPDA